METQVTSSRSLVSNNTQKASVDKVRSYLLYGNKADGLEYAMLKDIVRKSVPSLKDERCGSSQYGNLTKDHDIVENESKEESANVSLYNMYKCIHIHCSEFLEFFSSSLYREYK